MNLSELFEAEPGLKTIADKAGSQRRHSYCSRIFSYENIKNEAAGLVGFGARNPLLRTDDAWTSFVRHISEKLQL